MHRFLYINIVTFGGVRDAHFRYQYCNSSIPKNRQFRHACRCCTRVKVFIFLNIGTSIMVIFLKIYTIFFLQQRTLAKKKIQNLNFVFISFNLPKMGKVGFELVKGFFVFACVLCFKRNHCVQNIVLCNKNNQKICFKIDFPPPFHL